MLGSTRSRSIGRIVTSSVAFALGAAGVVVSPAPVEAVRAVPWRFTTVTLDSSISGWNGAEPLKGWVLQCPAGYTAVSGGIVGGDATSQVSRLLEYPNPADGTYHLVAYNGATSGTTIKLAATCVWLDDVGTITTVSREFPRNSSGRAGGELRCPAGTTVLSGGVDWSTTSRHRRIYYSSPITDGTSQGTGWYVAGYSDVPNSVLGIELRCVSTSLLGAEYAEADDSTAPSPGSGTAKAVCTSGYRLLTGGAAPAGTRTPGTYQGRAVSGPLDPRQWPAQGYQMSGVTLRALALCVPASSVSVTFTQTPSESSTARSGTITFIAADSAGETVEDTCYLNGVQRACSSGTPANYGPLVDGGHSFHVIATNRSGSSRSSAFYWRVDATVPVVSGHTPTGSASLTGPLTITFSEPVTGVTASSLIVHAESANANVAGTIARPSSTTATWTPLTRLVPGETYRVSLTGAIRDAAGNALTPTYFNVRTTTTVENTSVALDEHWDLDGLTAASGGSYITSRLSGSRAELTFSATAGQTVSVYGIQRPDGGYADVYLDGVKKTTPSFYATTPTRSRVYLSGALTAGTHTISIRPLGTKPAASSDTSVAVDNVNIGATVRQESALRQTFRRTSSTSAYGGSYDLTVHTTDTDATPPRFRVIVVGTGFKLYAAKTPTSGKARVYVDGVLKTTIDLYSASTVYKALVYSTSFSLGQHGIRIEAVGTGSGTNSTINVDRIAVD
jgi:hypothetical protein